MFKCLSLAFLFSFSTLALAEKVNTGYFSDEAVKGYDVVSYFGENGGKAVEGNDKFEYKFQKATYKFANKENLEKFKANPAKYVPQYGGYCAYAVANGSTAGIDPEAFEVVDGKLYLNYSKGVKAKWSKDKPGYIAKADKNWKTLGKD